MDERIEKAFDVANYMATLSNQRRVILEEFNQQLIYYANGGTFKISKELIVFVKTMIELGYTSEVSILDENNLPILIADVQEFFDNISSKYFESLNNYALKYNDIKSKRKVEDIVRL